MQKSLVFCFVAFFTILEFASPIKSNAFKTLFFQCIMWSHEDWRQRGIFRRDSFSVPRCSQDSSGLREGRHSKIPTDRYLSKHWRNPPNTHLLLTAPPTIWTATLVTPSGPRTLHPLSHAPPPSQQPRKHWRTSLQWTLVTINTQHYWHFPIPGAWSITMAVCEWHVVNCQTTQSWPQVWF